ncbi:hypothetical protein FGG08_003451 [Glutinoglossum americanum]|uniref:Uncharacterized protein n=1 Tax=Glutinoglossum americanum TaxID=1670608 RepID=A0A9P8IDA7_9PEZI|nr:hypothetical protein FGG08_003451 [Glutinoglossum americanum]
MSTGTGQKRIDAKTAKVDESSNSPWTGGYNSTSPWTGGNFNNTLPPPADSSGTLNMEYISGNNYRSTGLAHNSSAYLNDEGTFRGSSSLRYNALTGASSSSSSTDQTPSDQSTSHLSLPSRKRPFDLRGLYFGDADRQETKSRRTTPSSNNTGFSSPPVNQMSLADTGYSSPAYGYDSDVFLDATAGDEEVARRVAAEAVGEFGSDPDFIRRSQAESERKAREKAEQEQRDHELALLLSSTSDPNEDLQFLYGNQHNFPTSDYGGFSWGNLEDPVDNSYLRSAQNAPTSNAMPLDIAQGTSSEQAGGLQLSANDFVDLASSDDDLTEIDASAFRSNSRPDRNQLNQPSRLLFDQMLSDYTTFGQFQQTQSQQPSSSNEFDRLQRIQLPSINSNTSAPKNHLLPFPLNYAQEPFAGSAYSFGPTILNPSGGAMENAFPSFGTNFSTTSSRPINNDPLSIVDPNGTTLIDSYSRQRTARELHYIDYVTHDPTKTAEEIKNLLENIRPDVELPPENREGTPPAMKYPLMEHQKLGLAWLKSMEEGTNKGGILADDMGLGKTIQALALLVSRPSDDPQRKTTLIVAPVALMKQWEREIQTKLKDDHQLKTYLLHGSRTKVGWKHLKKYDVVLTTFGTLAAEYKRREAWEQKKASADGRLDNEEGPSLPCLSEDSLWYRVIIDEAQCIKNRTTKAALGACALQAKSRFCLTGTPMMNSVGELHALIEFLRIKPYNEFKKFSEDFIRPLKGTSQRGSENALKKLQALLKAVLLRRTKKSEIDGKPILNLPERTNKAQNAVFNEDEQTFYKALETKTALQFNKYLKQGSIGRNYTNILVLLLRLRQACCHPHLIQDMEVQHNAEITVDEMTDLAKSLLPDVISRVKAMDGFECPICYDGVENPAIFIPCGHDTCTECFVKISNQSGQQNLARGNEVVSVKCPTCRGLIDPKKIIDYVTFKKVHMREEGFIEEVEDTIEEDNSETEDSASDSDTDSDLADFVVPDDDDQVGADRSSRESSNKKRRGAKGKGKAKVRKTLAQLKKDAMKNAKSKARYMRRLEKNWESSAKVDKCCEILEDIQSKGAGEKTIVFSQFTSLLDLLEVPISRAGRKYERYDGSMSSAKRNDAVIEFTDNPACKIMLVSLKAGNAGLNLVAASQVIILDPFWNPYIEEQAIDRSHRIGQLRPVTVHRILVKETVEDRILQLQDKKRTLIEGALDEKASKNIARLGNRELAFLFGVGGAPN